MPRFFWMSSCTFRRGRRRQGDQRRRADLVDDRADAAVLRTEIVAPLRNAVRLVDGVERYLDFAQKRDVVLLGKRLGGEIEQLGAPLQHVGAHLRHGGLVERRIEEMGDARLRRESAHGVHLILHQGDQRRNDDRHAVHQQRRQLVTERLAARPWASARTCLFQQAHCGLQPLDCL